MGGVATAVRNKHAANSLKVGEGESEEYIITRHDQFSPAINVINHYGSQESRQSHDEIKIGLETIISEIMKIEAKDERIIYIGDLNRHVGTLIEGNHDKTTAGGKMLKEFLESGKYVLLNSLNCVVNGPFTRYDPSHPNDEEKKSVLDIVIVSRELVRFVDKLEIDKDLQWTPSRPVG